MYVFNLELEEERNGEMRSAVASGIGVVGCRNRFIPESERMQNTK